VPLGGTHRHTEQTAPHLVSPCRHALARARRATPDAKQWPRQWKCALDARGSSPSPGQRELHAGGNGGPILAGEALG
jgi:hypothetical protein